MTGVQIMQAIIEILVGGISGVAKQQEIFRKN